MYDPDNFNEEPFRDNSDHEKEGASETEYKEQQAFREPHWYGVSYQNERGSFMPPIVEPMQAAPPKKSGRGKKIAVIAVIVAVCMLCSAMAGLGGVFFVGTLNGWFAQEDDDPYGDQEGNGGTQQEGGVQDSANDGSGTQSGTGNGTTATPYPNTDSGYDYAAAFDELVKNSNDALIGSANGSAGDHKQSLIATAAAVKDSVVEITTTTTSYHGISAGAGSGVIIHEDGIIVTNNHVIEGCDNIYVRLTNGDTYVATLRGTNEDGDIAIIKITPQAGKPLTVASLGYSKALALGEEVIAIGNPLGELGGTVTNGIISALEREISVDGVKMTLLQTNAAINSGNSGGGLFNMAGELIGVVNAKYSATGVEGLGFAIPIDAAYKDSFEDLFKYGYIRGIPTMGLSLADYYTDYSGRYYCARVLDNGSHSGITNGDYVYSINGTQVWGTSSSSVEQIKAIIRALSVGDTVSVKFLNVSTSTYYTCTIVLQEYIPEGTGLNIQE